MNAKNSTDKAKLSEYFLIETYGVNNRIVSEGTKAEVEESAKLFLLKERARRISERPEYKKEYSIKNRAEILK